MFSRVLDSQINKVISAADVKSPLELSLPGLVSIAKQLRRATLRALRQSSAGALTDIPQATVAELPRSGTDLTNPMFQQGSILDEDGDEVRVLAFLVESRSPPYTRLKSRLVSVDEIEARTGLNFFPDLPKTAQADLESHPAGRLWPWLMPAFAPA